LYLRSMAMEWKVRSSDSHSWLYLWK